jgi:hypothetical protein
VVSGPLSDQLEAIPGVAAVEVTLPDAGPPHARIWLDGTTDPDDVRRKVRALLGSHVPARPVRDRPTRRSGLGRSLGELLIDDGPETVPHIHGGTTSPAGMTDAQQLPSVRTVPDPVLSGVQRVGVVEALDGVHVEVEAMSGDRRSRRVGSDGSIDHAVVGAISELYGLGTSLEVRVSDMAVEEGDVVVATALRSDGRRSAGAAFVEFGRPWALAVAFTDAIRTLAEDEQVG